MERRLIVISVGVALMGATAGYALGGYATGGAKDSAPQSDWWGTDAAAADTATTPVETGTAAVDGPENYVCKGCGPTLADRRAEGLYAPIHDPVDAGYVDGELEPMPSYHPAPSEGGVQGGSITLPTY